MRIRTLQAAAVGALALALTGCVGGEPLPTLPPTPSATPIFASEEEALAAAEAAYAAYLEMSSLIASEGGEDPERIAPFVTEERLVDELRGFATLRENGLRVVGETLFSVIDLQRWDAEDPNSEIVFYACWDASGTRVIDASDSDVTPIDRAVQVVLEVSVVAQNGQLPLVIGGEDEWPELSCA